MTLLSDLRDGWQMFLPYAEEVITPRRRVALLTLSPVLSVGVATVFRLVVGSAGGPFGSPVAALSGGLFAGSILCLILLLVWRPRLSDHTTFSGRSVPRYATPSPEADKEIRAADAEGREPEVTVPQRLAAADAARRGRLVFPRWVMGSVGGATFVVPYALFIVAAWPNIGPFGGLLSVLVAWWGVPSGLIGLARTTPPIETAQEVPSDYHADGRKIEKPYKLLGTDNPADYT